MKPTLYFFKLRFSTGVCGHCTKFEESIFNFIIKDKKILSLIDIEKVEFGTDEDGRQLVLDVDFPDLVRKVTYGPYVYLTPPFDPNDTNLKNEIRSPRASGYLFDYSEESTYEEFRKWLIKNLNKIKGVTFAK